MVITWLRKLSDISGLELRDGNCPVRTEQKFEGIPLLVTYVPTIGTLF